ncbi:MAG: Uncharacterised protein [Flavobacteriaceae bacterium]|nr:MAG: Uncharacterised protein [Flavobacteriaceae bacterium]|tara:strand:- start:400 stop:660 length:261 start_codon:yes stop_codon:yes gene_type:complete
MITLFKTISIILLVYYGLKIILKLAAPFIMKYFSKKLAARFGAGFSDKTPPNTSQKKEGEISIDKVPNTKKTSKTVGQYIDFEEIE